ncbi:uncharacterized protein LOC134801870 isoform X2 [Cydia splendana]|uniref:uncharacterized protein LOC134801870 isoform X2 n=1 Tax=Cydia splendana TaxID=1100963 RepID=UPI00300CE95C
MRVLLLLFLLAPLVVFCRHPNRRDQRIPEARQKRRHNPQFPDLLKVLTENYSALGELLSATLEGIMNPKPEAKVLLTRSDPSLNSSVYEAIDPSLKSFIEAMEKLTKNDPSLNSFNKAMEKLKKDDPSLKTFIEAMEKLQKMETSPSKKDDPRIQIFYNPSYRSGQHK